MDKNRKRLALKNKVARLLTLISFFHLSGLNNGFTQVAFVAGQMDSFNFAPVVIEKTIQVLNPKVWKQAIFRTPKVIEFASQRAISIGLIESNLTQLYLKNILTKKFIHRGFSTIFSGTLGSQALIATLFAHKKVAVKLVPLENSTKPSIPMRDVASRKILYDRSTAHASKIKEYFWDDLAYLQKQSNMDLDKLSGVVYSQMSLLSWIGVGSAVKFMGMGYNRTKSGGDWSQIHLIMTLFRENILSNNQDVSFLGEQS